jgi:D-alanyl-D-alanine carboxypeptidase
MTEAQLSIHGQKEALVRRQFIKRVITGLGIAGAAGAASAYLLPDFMLSCYAGYAVEDLLNTLDVSPNHVGFCLNCLQSGREIYSHRGGELLVCGSNRKLFLSAAALLALGKSFSLNTPVYCADTSREGTLNGALYIRGAGDPLLTRKDLDRLATDIASSGVRHIEGNIVGDGTAFTASRLYGSDSTPSDNPEKRPAWVLCSATNGTGGWSFC